MTSAQITHKAMLDLRAGRITADEYRAIMREQKAATGGGLAWERAKFSAIARDLR